MKRPAVETWLQSFAAALASGDVQSAVGLFTDPCYWRDMVAFTWNIHTCEGRAAIADMLDRQLGHVHPRDWQIDGEASENPEGWTEAWLTFQTEAGPGKAHVRLIDGRCWTLLTTLSELDGHPPAVGRNRARGQTHGVIPGRRHWAEQAAIERAAIGAHHQPYCLIIGGGQGGMALGARLKHLGVPALIVEKNPRAGDNWRNRYPSLCLHDPVWYDHMPFLPFPPDWPVFTPKDRVADWLEFYAGAMDLNYWTSSLVTSASYDDDAGHWHVIVERDGVPVTLTPSHLVFATGMSGYPHIPQIPGQDQFAGPQVHSSWYEGGKTYAGKRCVVIGANTSAHDICLDLFEQGAASVTMVQRSGTMVVQTETVLDVHLAPLYSEDALARGIDTETADYIATTWPHRLVEQRSKMACAEMRRRDAELHERLSAVGFIHDFGEDETGLACKSIREGGGFYINVGACEAICSGEIALKSGVGIDALKRDAVVLSDGTQLSADAVIYATGYRSMNEFVADIVGREVADQVGPCWGVGSATRKDPGPWEGELRNMWKPTAHPALWFQGGNLAQSRHFSRFLAVQLKARMEGIPTPVYPGH